MEKVKKFSIAENNMEVYDGLEERVIVLLENGVPFASSAENLTAKNIIQIPQSVFYATDEDLALKNYPVILDENDSDKNIIYREIWLDGRKSHGNKYHLSLDELNEFSRTCDWKETEEFLEEKLTILDPIEIEIEFLPSGELKWTANY